MILLARLPKSIIKKYGITKKAWRVFRGQKSRTSRTRRAKPSRRKGVRRLARRRRRRSTRTIPILPILGIAGGLQDPIQRAVAGDFMGALHEARNIMTGFDEYGGWHPEWMVKFWGPTFGGVLMHKVANFIGVNRQFAKLPSPLNKLRL